MIYFMTTVIIIRLSLLVIRKNFDVQAYLLAFLCGYSSNVSTTMFRNISIHLYLLFTSVGTILFRNICKFGMRRWRHCIMTQAYGKRYHSAMILEKRCISLQCLAWRIRNDKECIYPARFNGDCCVSDLEMTFLSFGYFVYDKSSIRVERLPPCSHVKEPIVTAHYDVFRRLLVTYRTALCWTIFI